MGFIYRIYHKETDESYIGQTKKTVQSRWKEHQREALYSLEGIRRDFSYFHRRLIWEGFDKFDVEVLEETDDLDIREKYWIAYYDSYNNGYNFTTGGQNNIQRIRREGDYKWKTKQQKHIPNNKWKTLNQDIDDIKRTYTITDKVKNHKRGKPSKMVNEYSLQGELVNTHCSANEAARATSSDQSAICDCCNGKTNTHNERIWIYKEDKEKIKQLFTPVIRGDGKIFENTFEAALSVKGTPQGIIKCCLGLRKKHKGRLWRWKDKI